MFVVGGGERVDQVRTWSERFGLSESESHWLSIETMQLNAIDFGFRMPNCSVVEQVCALSTDPAVGVVFAPRDWLRNLDPPLPESWDVTSDSIAARLACEIGAELVLMKSATPHSQLTLQSLAEIGFVDRYFPNLNIPRPIRWVNLRGAQMPEGVIG